MRNSIKNNPYPGSYQNISSGSLSILFLLFSLWQSRKSLHCLTEQYINKTKGLRPSSYDALFISLTKPYRTVTSQNMSR